MIYFIAPNFNSFISGGNIFNKQIVTALEELGKSVKQLEYPLRPDFKVHFDDTVVVDSIYTMDLDLNQLNDLACKKYFICHLLPSMIGSGHGLEYEKKVLKVFDGIIVNSMFCKNVLDSMDLSSERYLIQPFIDRPVAPEQNDRIKNALLIANWVPVKQLGKMLQCLAKQKQLPLPITVIGSTGMDPAYFKDCMDMITRSELLKEKIHVMGSLDRKATWSNLFQSKVLLDCSSFETYGMAVAEVVSIGKPVLTLGNGNTKYLVPPGSICNSIDDLVDRLINEIWIVPEAQYRKKIITVWGEFLNQFRVWI